MRIVIDARYIGKEYTGIGTYSLNFLQSLAAHCRDIEFIVIIHTSYRDQLSLPDNFRVIKYAARPVSINSVLFFGLFVDVLKPDILHTLAPIVPVISFRKRLLISCVYDLQPIQDPKFTWRPSKFLTILYNLFYRHIYPSSMRRSNFIVCPSYATRRYITNMMPSVADKTIVIPMAVPQDMSADPLNETTLKSVKTKYNIPNRFILYVGSTRPNKNLLKMLEAFDLFTKTNDPNYPVDELTREELHWVLIIKPDRFWNEIQTEIRKRQLTERIHIYEQVSTLAKQAFIMTADLLYFVTKFEGFGLPVLEAQSKSTPVLTSTHSSLPEVAGEGALYADSDNEYSICKQLFKFFGPDHQAIRDDLIAKGLENVKRYDWNSVIKDHLDIYKIFGKDGS